MKELTELLKGVEVDIDTSFGVITLKSNFPATPIGRFGKNNLIDLYKKILELKNK